MNFLQVLQGITLPEMDILDNFEDVEYERRTVDVALTVSIIQLSMFKYEIYNCSTPHTSLDHSCQPKHMYQPARSGNYPAKTERPMNP